MKPSKPIDAATTDALHRAVASAFEPAQVPWLATLVEQPSHTYERDDVESAARILDALAGDLDLETVRHPDPSGRFADHRVYHTRAAGPVDPALALVGHVDTVFPRKQGFFGFRRDGGVVRGPGVLDMKSGLTAMFFALRALREVDPEAWRRLRVRVVVVSDEEVGSPSSNALFAALAPHTEAALVFESGREHDRVVTARKGSALFHLTAHGRAAHAGALHHEGVSAIHALALVVPRLEEMTDYARGLTVNVGLFEGGTAKNTVPDLAKCAVDVRFAHAEDGRAVARFLETLVATPPFPPRLADARLELAGGLSRPPMEPTADVQLLRRRYEAHAAAAGLGTGECPLQGGGSDANLLAAAGVPSIDGLGPYGRHFHRTDEWASLDSLLRKTQALATFLATWS